MRITNRFLLALYLLGLFLVAGCSGVGFRLGPPFNLGYTAPKEEPVYIEDVRLDGMPVMPGGILGQDWQRVSGLVVLAPPYPPFPHQIFVRWFNYKQQRFYEATVSLREDASDVMRHLPKSDYGGLLLVTGVLPDGQAMVWVANAHAPKFGSWIEVGRVQGRQVEGDVENYRPQIESMRKRGRI